MAKQPNYWKKNMDHRNVNIEMVVSAEEKIKRIVNN